MSKDNKVRNVYSQIILRQEIRWKSQSNYFEEYIYQIWLIYMYILNMIKQFRFDKDKSMRAKIIWKQHLHKNSSLIPHMPCLCMYLLDAKSLIKCINDQTFRDKSIAVDRNKYFWKKEGEENWKIRENKKEELTKLFKEMIQDHKYIESIEYALKVDMNEFKN